MGAEQFLERRTVDPFHVKGHRQITAHLEQGRRIGTLAHRERQPFTAAILYQQTMIAGISIRQVLDSHRHKRPAIRFGDHRFCSPSDLHHRFPLVPLAGKGACSIMPLSLTAGISPGA